MPNYPCNIAGFVHNNPVRVACANPNFNPDGLLRVNCVLSHGRSIAGLSHNLGRNIHCGVGKDKQLVVCL